MAEVLFYERPVPLNRTQHKDLRLKSIPGVKFAAAAHSVPLTVAEFPMAARDVPILFAGTCNMYSKSAIPQLIKMIATSGRLSLHFMSLNFKCPYHASVMKALESVRRRMVMRALMGLLC